MSFRTVVIANRSKLDLRMGYLVIRKDSGTMRVFLDEINTVIIENPACSITYRFVNDLWCQSHGESGEAVLSRDDLPVPIHGNIELLTDFFPFDINRKNLITRISSKLEKQAVSPEFYEKSQLLLSNVENLIHELAYYNDLDLDFPKLSLSSILKSSGICLKEDDLSLPEKILTYIDLMNSNALASIFVFVNLRSIMNEKTIENFTDCCCSHEYNIMLIDNHANKIFSREQRSVIDIDLCEF